jgi:hypothetical protein
MALAAAIVVGAGLLGTAVTAGAPSASAASLTGARADAADPAPVDSGLSDRLQDLAALPSEPDPEATAAQVDDAAAELGVAASGAASLQLDDEARVAVSIRYTEGPAQGDIDAVTALGGAVTASSELFGRASAYVPLGGLDALATLPHVASVSEALKPATGADSDAELTADASAAASLAPAASLADAPASCRTVPPVSAAPLRADLASQLYGVDGSGVTVGIISDSYDRSATARSTPAQDVAAGLLPGPGNPCGYETPVEDISDPYAPEDAHDEGRGMAQMVHSVAPGARIVFASVGTDTLTMSDAVRALADAGANVIVDDIYFFEEPTYQDGPLAVTIDDVAARGVTYLSSAGNYTSVGAAGRPSAGYPITSWATTQYRPTSCPADVLTALGAGSFDCMDFDQGPGEDPTDTLTFTARSDNPLSLQWAEPVGYAHGDFRLALSGPSGVELFAPSAAGDPVADGAFDVPTAGTYALSIVRATTAGQQSEITPPLRVLIGAKSALIDAEYFLSQGNDTVGATVSGHSTSEGALSIAAAPWADTAATERFSSSGPAVHYFDYDPHVSPVPVPLPGAQVLAKPDVTSVDRGWSNFFGSPVPDRTDVFQFAGTSAAAPTAAAVVALAKQAAPDATAAELRDALRTTARPIDSPFATLTATQIGGSGLVDAAAYVAAVRAEAPPAPPAPVPAAEGVTRLAATGAAVSDPGIAVPGILAVALLAAGGVLLAAFRLRVIRPDTRRRS